MVRTAVCNPIHLANSMAADQQAGDILAGPPSTPARAVQD